MIIILLSGYKLMLCLLGGTGVHFSQSPMIHNNWCKFYGINAQYITMELKDEEDLQSFVQHSIKKYIGCNVTMPYKVKIIEMLDYISPEVNAIGSINTVKILTDKQLSVGYNSDFLGIIHTIKMREFASRKPKNESMLVIGAGGTARAAAYAGQKLGVKNIYIVNRTASKARHMSNEYKNCYCTSLKKIASNGQQFDIIVNACPQSETLLEILNTYYEKPHDGYIIDANYMDESSKFAESRLSTRYGKKYISGQELLLVQAAYSFNIWFGKMPIASPLENGYKMEVDLDNLLI